MFLRRISSMRRVPYYEESQYLDLIRKTITNGDCRTGRNGNILSTFGYQMRFNLRNKTFPLLTTKRVAWQTCLHELLWFIKGSTDVTYLQNRGVRIWNGNAGKDKDLGPIYGHQWRYYNAPYSDCDTNYKGKGVDQLQNIIDSLKNPEEKYSRRLILNAWNPCQLSEMKLPPCHVLSQYWVNSHNELHCHLYQRSGDIGLGVPFNIASYSALTHLLAHHCGLKPGEFVYSLGDAHIYEEHVSPLQEQIKRECLPFPKLYINTHQSNIEEYRIYDFDVMKYNYHKKINMTMVV